MPHSSITTLMELLYGLIVRTYCTDLLYGLTVRTFCVYCLYVAMYPVLLPASFLLILVCSNACTVCFPTKDLLAFCH